MSSKYERIIVDRKIILGGEVGYGFQQCFGSGSVSGSAWIRIKFASWIRIRIQLLIN